MASSTLLYKFSMCVATGSDSRMRRVESSNKTTAVFCTTYNCIPYGVQFVLIIVSVIFNNYMYIPREVLIPVTRLNPGNPRGLATRAMLVEAVLLK